MCSLTLLTTLAQVGSLDTTFGNHGIVTTEFNKVIGGGQSQASFTSVVVQGKKIVAAGYTAGKKDGYDWDFALARYNNDGALDSSFGKQGKVTTGFGSISSDDKISSVLLQGARIVAAGTTPGTKNDGFDVSDFALARYTKDGTLDSKFGVNGKVTTDVNDSYDVVRSMVLQGDKILVAGRIDGPGLVRYTKDGVLDSTFGENGRASIPNLSEDDYLSSVVLQGEKILVAGFSIRYIEEIDERARDFVLACYTKDGALDPSFGVNGAVITDVNSYSGGDPSSILLQGDKIVVGRTADFDFDLVRYTRDGVLDSSFGVNGIVKTYTGDSYAYTYTFSALLQGDKIVVAGRTAMARYTKDGVLDQSFGVNGIVRAAAPISSIAIQNNQLIAVGSLSNAGGTFGMVAAYRLEDQPSLPTISSFTLVNASSDKDIQPLMDGDELDLTKLPPVRINIRANTSPAKVGSVVLELSGTQERKQVENGVPYALFKNLRGDYFGGNLQAGEYTLTATPYTKAKAQGEQGTPLTVHFKIVYPVSVVSFTLVNAETGEDMRELKEGSVLNLSSFPAKKLSVRANTNPESVGSVLLSLSGEQTHRQTENLAPYALFGGNPYNAWVPGAGSYTLSATPYSAREGKGAKGTSYTIHFTVTQGFPSVTTGNHDPNRLLANNADAIIFLHASPNPFTHNTVIRYSLSTEAKLSLRIYDVLGQEVSNLFTGIRKAGAYWRNILLPRGSYCCKRKEYGANFQVGKSPLNYLASAKTTRPSKAALFLLLDFIHSTSLSKIFSKLAK